MVGVIAAMEIEALGLIERLSDTKTEEYSGIKFVRGRYDGCDVVVAICGIGKVFAAVCTELMIIKYSPSIIINTGVAGTLTPEISIGDIIIADKLVQHDMDTSAIGDPCGFVSGINVIDFETDKELSLEIKSIADSMGEKSVFGKIATGDVFVNDKALKSDIVEKFSAKACEMEGAAIAQVCYINAVRFAAIRVISDDAGGEKETDYNIFVKAAAKKSLEMVCEFIKKIKDI